MLVIRMQRTGRSGHAQFRVVVQDSRRTPTSGKVVASLGHFNPHTKEIALNKEKASFFLEHGAQPSERVARLLKSEGIKLPAWVKIAPPKKGSVRNADKRRSTRPDEPVAKEEPAAEAASEEPTAEVPETSEPTAKEATPEEPEAEVAEVSGNTDEEAAASVDAEVPEISEPESVEVAARETEAPEASAEEPVAEEAPAKPKADK